LLNTYLRLEGPPPGPGIVQSEGVVIVSKVDVEQND
jgi:hypothetical protein